MSQVTMYILQYTTCYTSSGLTILSQVTDSVSSWSHGRLKLNAKFKIVLYLFSTIIYSVSEQSDFMQLVESCRSHVIINF